MHPQRIEDVRLSVSIVSHNGMKVLPLCLESIAAQTFQPDKVFVIDNASTDGTPDWVRANHPAVEVIHHPFNHGPNPARNVGISRSPHPLVALIDDDAVLEPACLEELVRAYLKYPDAAAWVPRIVYHDRPDMIQLDGVKLHYMSEAILINADRPVAEAGREPRPIDIAAGICLLVSREAALALGGYDDYYFFGRDDGELMLRMRVAGHQLYAVPAAVCHHRVKPRGFGKLYYQVRNRWFLTLSVYSGRTLLLLAPAFFVYELSLMAFVAAKGGLREYARAMLHLGRDLPQLRQRRRVIQATRKVPDRQFLHPGVIGMRRDLLDKPWLTRIKAGFEGFFNLYWRWVSPLL
jgi:GT2 family glycosyltransferase